MATKKIIATLRSSVSLRSTSLLFSLIILITSICGTARAQQPVPILELVIPDTARVVDHDSGVYAVGTDGGNLYVINEAGEYTVTALGAGNIYDVRIENQFIAVVAGSDTVLKFLLNGLIPVEQWRQPAACQRRQFTNSRKKLIGSAGKTWREAPCSYV